MKLNQVVCAMFAFSASTSAMAAHVIDQQFTSNDGSYSNFTNRGDNAFHRAQSFTAGQSGVLDEIDILISGTPSFSGFNLLSTSGGLPTQNIIATGTYAGQTADGWTSFSLNYSQVAGTEYAFEPITISDQTFWLSSSNGGYAGGSDNFINTVFNIDSYTATPSDNVFRTYVSLGNVVPEPTTWAMMLVGMGSVGVALRRRGKLSVSYV